MTVEASESENLTDVEWMTEMENNLELLEQGTYFKDLRMIGRIVRRTYARSCPIRKKMTPALLISVVENYVPVGSGHRERLRELLRQVPHEASDNDGASVAAKMEVDGSAKTTGYGGKSNGALVPLPEMVAYVHVMVLILLIDRGLHPEALTCAEMLVDYLARYNRRTMDDVQAHTFFFLSLAYEKNDRLHELRPRLFPWYRTAALYHNSQGQAMLINLLLRSYIRNRLYDQADKFASKAPFPDSRNNNQLARYFFYLGRIRAIQLDYSEAARCLEEATRKSPQGCALGFRVLVQKFNITVQLLMGDIPERSVFRQREMTAGLRPYLSLTKAVRVGDVHAFQEALIMFSDQFQRDETYPLIARLHHSVIKTGLRKINLSYSRISIADICQRLGLESVDDTECIVAKAIRDGVIDGMIDHEGGFFRSQDHVDVYSTIGPTNAFHDRITFCLKIHNEAVRAMRFPDLREDPEIVEELRREKMREERELAKKLAEEEEEEDEDF
mmetsp:Transcript_2306/g.3971  ORF Transcript_2306/g.3971 Transcript_2306/m.3971 type:complete len:501 (-) Transcript_2306:601-2103(-)|eukprot:CAMPEP_0184684402 /NCGR_PEP_ID=MMETSP0312-20130426/15177_1 /TAXON_ID=31354 /ORGANISM="Compsopogon coeruleus, Strain SAG 36.94" /LENGTH=500 /DNA_ID=CAMNT_0027137545 /DNA_START=58 /DNA_END=1560 /DNA_ORIENTATION=-